MKLAVDFFKSIMGPDSRSQQLPSLEELGNQFNVNQHKRQNNQRRKKPNLLVDTSFPTPSFSNVLTPGPGQEEKGFSPVPPPKVPLGPRRSLCDRKVMMGEWAKGPPPEVFKFL